MKTESDRITQTPEDIVSELRALVAEAEKVLQQSSPASCRCDSTLDTLRDRLGTAQERLTQVYEDARRKVVAGAKQTDTTIREHPYQSIAIAAGIGLLAGVLAGRRWTSSR